MIIQLVQGIQKSILINNPGVGSAPGPVLLLGTSQEINESTASATPVVIYENNTGSDLVVLFVVMRITINSANINFTFRISVVDGVVITQRTFNPFAPGFLQDNTFSFFSIPIIATFEGLGGILPAGESLNYFRLSLSGQSEFTAKFDIFGYKIPQ
jgi:hypothetical protein